jgi:hypothetical protein
MTVTTNRAGVQDPRSVGPDSLALIDSSSATKTDFGLCE